MSELLPSFNYELGNSFSRSTSRRLQTLSLLQRQLNFAVSVENMDLQNVSDVKRYQWRTYTSKRRWNSYWHQIDEVLSAEPRACLVVGVGDGIIADVLVKAGIRVTTLDVDRALKPDIVGDVADIPLLTKNFDVTLCCQVLEHIEYTRVPKALAELKRVTRQRLIVSVPDKSRSLDVFVRIGSARMFRRVHLPSRHTHRFDGKHHWELGTLTTPTRSFRRLIASLFQIEKEFQVQEFAYHHFFVLAP